jgi:endoplasmic reticulum-Golgi intermediate compartment protein 3
VAAKRDCTVRACIMPAKSRFTRLDAFTKTVEDARIRTTSGGVVTIVSLLVILYLIWGEWSDYRKIIVQPELIVDKGRGQGPAE